MIFIKLRQKAINWADIVSEEFFKHDWVFLKGLSQALYQQMVGKT